MKYDIKELKEFIKFYIPYRNDIEEELFRRYTEDGIEIKSDIYDTIESITIRDSIKHCALKYSEEELKEVLDLYTRHQDQGELCAEEAFNSCDFEMSQEEYDEIYLTKTLEFVIELLNEKQ